MKKLHAYWKYIHDDITTWKYLDCAYTEGLESRKFKKWVLNPEFKYMSQDPYYNYEQV